MLDQRARTTLVVGIGNPLRGDDGAGCIVARKIGAMHLPGVKVLEHMGGGINLIHAWKSSGTVIIVDAALSQEKTGTILRFSPPNDSVPGVFRAHSTHEFGISETVELAKILQRLPERLIVYGIVGRDFFEGDAVCPEVYSAIDRVVQKVVDNISCATLPTIM
jgi:hydrogenase maturation protease